jgi:hypothetical protein
LGVNAIKKGSRLFGVGSHNAASWRSALFMTCLLEVQRP